MKIPLQVTRHFTLKAKNQESGFALIFVLMLVAIIVSIITDILFESELASRTSLAERDRIRAEASAITGAAIARLLVQIDGQVENLMNLASSQNAAFSELARKMKSDIEGQMGGKSIATLLDGVPIGAAGLDQISDFSKINLNSLLDESLIAALKSVPGTFVIETSNESSKLNLNNLAGAKKVVTKVALTRMFSGENELRLLQDHNLTPEVLAGNVVDYVDTNNIAEVGGGPEDAVYVAEKFQHRAKNGPFESLEELHRVPGFHYDEIYNVFVPYFTIWPVNVKTNNLIDVNKIPVELLGAFFAGKGNADLEQSPALDKLEDRRANKEQFTQKQALSDFFNTEFGATKDPDSKNLVSQLIGYESAVYKVRVTGMYGKVSRTLTTVLERSVSNNTSTPAVKPTPTVAPPGQPIAALTPSSTQAPPVASDDDSKGGKVRVVYQKFD
jgi:type II secretory pathway component PulK